MCDFIVYGGYVSSLKTDQKLLGPRIIPRCLSIYLYSPKILILSLFPDMAKYVMILSPQHHPALSLIFFLLLSILLFPPCCASVSDTNANVRARVANCLDQLFHADVAFWVDSQVRNVRFIDLSIIILQKHIIRDWIGLVQKGF